MSDQGAGGTAGETESAYSQASDACNCTDDEGAPPGGRARGLSVEFSGLSVGSLPSCPSSPGVYHLTAVVGGSPSVSPLAGARHPGRAATAPALLRQHSSWLKRAESKTQSLRRIFDLPADEQVVDDYVCALRKRVLVQGRLYVFQRHLCFHSNLFGYRTNQKVALKDVVSVERRKNVGFPNSIKLRTAGGEKLFFTSFLSREDAYRLIVTLWRRCSGHAAEHPESDAEGEGRVGGGGLRRQGSGGMLMRPVSKLLRRVTRPGEWEGGSPRHSLLLAAAAAPAPRQEQSEPILTGMEQGTGAPLGHQRVSASSDCNPASIADNPSQDGPGASPQPAPFQSDPDDEFVAISDQQCEQAIDAAFKGAVQPAPPLEADLRPMLEFELPCSPREFWCRFLSNHSDFFPAFHAAQQHHSIKLGRWQQHVSVGMVRDLTFVSPLKIKMGPPQTLCNQTQRYQVYAGDHLVFETSQVQLDIPYGDHFRVETRCDVTPRGAGACHLALRCRIPFSRSTVWRKFIEKGTLESLGEATALFRRLAEERLAQPRAAGQAAPAAAQAAALGAASPAAAGSQSQQAAASAAMPGSEQEWEAVIARAEPQLREPLRRLMQQQQAGGAGGSGVGSRAAPAAAAWRAPILQLLLCVLCLLILLTQLATLYCASSAAAGPTAASAHPRLGAPLNAPLALLNVSTAGTLDGTCVPCATSTAAAAALEQAQAAQQEAAALLQQLREVLAAGEGVWRKLEGALGGAGELQARLAHTRNWAAAALG